MWVVQEFKKWLKEVGLTRYALPVLEDLESGAPSSGLVRQIREDREKASAWDKLYDESKTFAQLRGIACQKSTLLSHMDELLAQSKTPPTAEEGKSDD